jgi:hypothetical protein
VPAVIVRAVQSVLDFTKSLSIDEFPFIVIVQVTVILHDRLIAAVFVAVHITVNAQQVVQLVHDKVAVHDTAVRFTVPIVFHKVFKFGLHHDKFHVSVHAVTVIFVLLIVNHELFEIFIVADHVMSVLVLELHASHMREQFIVFQLKSKIHATKVIDDVPERLSWNVHHHDVELR